MRRLFLIVAALLLLSGVIFIPDWFEDPRRLAPGEWVEQGTQLKAEVTDKDIHWRGLNNRGHLTYDWLQTDREPYRVVIRRGERAVEALVTFNGEDEAILEPEIFDKLPSLARRYIRERNRAHQRPEEEIRLIFRRVRKKKS